VITFHTWISVSRSYMSPLWGRGHSHKHTASESSLRVVGCRMKVSSTPAIFLVPSWQHFTNPRLRQSYSTQPSLKIARLSPGLRFLGRPQHNNPYWANQYEFQRRDHPCWRVLDIAIKLLPRFNILLARCGTPGNLD